MSASLNAVAPAGDIAATECEQRKTGLDSLPEETCLTILDIIQDTADWRTMLSLRATNEKWKRIATPYVSIPLGRRTGPAVRILRGFVVQEDEGHYDDAQGRTRVRANIGKLYHMLQLPNARPEWIKVIPAYVLAERPMAWIREFDMATSLARQLLKSTDELPRILRDSIYCSVCGTTNPVYQPDARLALVLLACTGLETLQFRCFITVDYGDMSRELVQYAAYQHQRARLAGDGRQQQARYRSILGRLRHLEIRDPLKQIYVADVVRLLSLPHMQTLTLWGVAGELAPRPLPDDLPTQELLSQFTSAPLSPDDAALLVPAPNPAHASLNASQGPSTRRTAPVDLTLARCCTLDDDGLTTMLAACGPAGGVRSLFVVAPVAPRCYANALAAHGEKLEFLWLDEARGGLSGDVRALPPPPPHRLGSGRGATARLLDALGRMRRLHTLAISRDALGDDIAAFACALPSSLRELLVIGHRDEVVDDWELEDGMDWEVLDALSDEEESSGDEEEEEEEEDIGPDRTELLKLVDHPNLPALELVKVVPAGSAQDMPEWRSLFKYCVAHRELPPPGWRWNPY
ncbi:hypothetical protein GGR52DRAFT_591707 [Hypoxylon sp. FL1284]|nr:hypothetical protein GGR52DRAFT_591707 [Hypoxylon sp. FL1284]